MNRSYRSIWNASLGCYVAAPECATAHPARTSSSRAVSRCQPMRSKVAMVLESRILFDGAMVATAIEADGVTDAPEIEAVEEVNDVVEESAESTQDVVEPEVVAHTVTDDAETAETPATDAGDDEADVFSEPVPATRNEVVFVDGRVNDPAAFASEGREVVVLSTEQDGMTQIASALSGRTGLTAIHIVSHGGDGYLSLGSGSVTAETIQSTNQASLQLIGQALAEDGDILIYACDYAAGESGLEAMELIADITGADVAASTDTTGHESLGGDWTLEQSTGEIEAQSLDVSSWDGELATYTGAELTSQLTLSGNATTVSSDTIRLTPNVGTQSGAVQSSFEIDLATDFNLSFSVYLGTSDAGADGVTFVMHNDPAGAQALGASGGGLGASGIENGVVIEFDTYDNGSPDLPNDHTSIWDSDSSEVLLAARDLGNIENGAWHAVTVTWTASTETLSYTFNGVSMGSTSGLVAAGRFGTGGTVHFGWTAATGGAMNDQQVRINSFTGDLNFAPTAVNDSFTASEEGATVLGNAASNDTDPELGALSAVVDSVVGSDGGTLGTDDSGNLVFMADSSFDDLRVGQTRDTVFNYTVYDDGGATDTATITVTVQGANDAPVAQDDHFDVTEDGGHTLGSVLGNDADLDSAEIWADINATAGSNGGEFSQDDSGNLIFIPGSSFDSLAVGETRDTSFSYVLHDSDGGQSAATVTVTVHGVNDSPVGGADDFVASEDAAISLGLVTQNDADIDGGEVYADMSAVGAGDQGGFFSFDDSGSLIFNPDDAFEDLGVGETRDTRFEYTLFDGQGASSTATVTVTVLGANDAPVAEDDSFVAYEDWALALGSLSGNDSDADGDDVYAEMSGSVVGSTGGRFWVEDSGNLVFDPEGDFEDLDAGETRGTSFTYMAYDGLGGVGEAEVTVTVTGVNDNPVAGDDHYEASADAAVSLGSPLGNDTDAEGHALVLEQTQVAAGSDGGQFSVDDGGSVSFDPAGAFDDLLVGETRDTSFTYTVLDSQGGVGSGTLTVTVHGVAVNPEEPAAATEGDVVIAGGEELSYPNEIVFVDARVPEPEAFATHGRELVIISTEQDGVVQMANALAGRSGIEAIHIVSHGGEGSVTLGLGDINANSFEVAHVAALQSIAQSLTEDGDILIYACEFAGGDTGLNALQMLSQHTQADVAASLFVTGDASLGGNWSLEATVGSVEASTIVPQDWAYLLDVPQAQPALPAVATAPEVVEAPMVANGAPSQTPVVTPLMVTAVTPAHETLAPVVLQEFALQTPNTVRVHDLETAMRVSLQAVLPVSSTEVAVVELHGDASEIASTIETASAWHVEREEIWTASRPWLDELALPEADAEVDEAEEPVRAAPGFRAQLNRFAQWGSSRPLTRAAARA